MLLLWRYASALPMPRLPVLLLPLPPAAIASPPLPKP
jgi:hypothetical protein